MTETVLRQLLLGFFIILSIMPLYGHIDHSNNLTNSAKITTEQKKSGESSKINKISRQDLELYKKYLPYCSTILKNIPRLYSFIMAKDFIDAYNQGRLTRYANIPESIGILISCITAMENICKEVVNHNHDTQQDTADKKDTYSNKRMREISWNLSKVISYPVFTISMIYLMSTCTKKKCTFSKHFLNVALTASTGYDTFYKPMKELIGTYRAIGQKRTEPQAKI